MTLVVSWTCSGEAEVDVDDQTTGIILISKYPARSQPSSNGWVFCSVGSTLCLAPPSCRPAINFAFYPLLLARVNYFNSNKLDKAGTQYLLSLDSGTSRENLRAGLVNLNFEARMIDDLYTTTALSATQ